MALPVVASKFALLPDDDEDLNKKALRQKLQPKKAPTASIAQAKSKKSKNKKKHKAEQTGDDVSKELQALAFGRKKPESSKSPMKSFLESTPGNNQLQASWINHDQMIADEAFASDLQQAIIASKIEFESKSSAAPEKKSSKKAVPMSLQTFNGLSNGDSLNNIKEAASGDKKDFFGDVYETMKRVIHREQMKDDIQLRTSVMVSDQPLLENYRLALQLKDGQISQLTQENLALSIELEKVKKRYKQFRDLLDQVECRDKAEVISENIKLKRVHEELFLELQALRQDNEKLKTKLNNDRQQPIQGRPRKSESSTY